MRALHVSTTRDLGGGERQALALVAGSRARGVDAVLAARRGGACAAAARERGLPVEELTIRFAYDPIASRNIYKLLKRGAFDLIHLHDGSAASVGVAAARLAGAPIVIHRRIASPLRASVFTRLKYDPRRVARFIAVSRSVASVLEGGGIPRDKIAVVPSGADLAALDAIARRTGAVGIQQMGTIAKLAPKKGVDVVLRAFAEIVKTNQNARLIVVGGGPRLDELRALATSLQIDRAVEFAGRRDDAAFLLANWDLFLYASELEGSPAVVREAMALRIPVVAADAPGTVEVLGDAGIVVNRGDHAAMAAAATELLQQPHRRAELAEAARARVVECYSLDAMVERTLTIAREVAPPRAGAINSPDACL